MLFYSSRRRHTRCALVTGVQTCALPIWALLGQKELAAGEFLVGPVQKDRHLERKDMLAVQVLVEAVIVACAVAKEERRRSRLAGFVAAGEKSGMGFRKVDAEAEIGRAHV